MIMILRQQCHLLRKARVSSVLERTPHKMKNSSLEYEHGMFMEKKKKEGKNTALNPTSLPSSWDSEVSRFPLCAQPSKSVKRGWDK